LGYEERVVQARSRLLDEPFGSSSRAGDKVRLRGRQKSASLTPWFGRQFRGA
jgi:hypothetical protein